MPVSNETSLKDIRLRTDCSQCTNKCCSQPYDWVYLTAKEIERISARSGLSEDQFVRRRRNAHTGHIFNSLNLPCRFLDNKSGRCTIYESRPLVCRVFPFYPEPLTGQATLLPAQCGPGLEFVSAADEGWSLGEFDTEIIEWLKDLWAEASNEQ